MKESTKKKLDSIDKSKIKVQESKDLLAKIEKALNNDKNEENQAKAEKLLDVFIAKAKAKNADIFKTEEPAKPKTPAQKKQVAQATKSKLDSLMDTIANDPLFKDFNSARRSKGGGKSDPLIDSERKARESGRRVSQKGWSNQYGKSKGGRRYYEYRENRIDRKAPTYGSKPWLEDGGLIHPSDKFQEKYSVIEIKGDGSRRVHNTFPDFETAMVFASLKRNVMPSNTRIVVEDEKGTTMYRSFMNGGEMPNGGKYYVMDAKDGKIVSQGFDTEEEAKAEMYKIFEKTRNPFLVPKKMAQGGKIDESTAMVLSQNKAIAHHTKELKNAISKNEKVEPWVIGKMQRASTDMSDVTHYFDGMTEYAKGGSVRESGYYAYPSGDEGNELGVFKDKKSMISFALANKDKYGKLIFEGIDNDDILEVNKRDSQDVVTWVFSRIGMDRKEANKKIKMWFISNYPADEEEAKQIDESVTFDDIWFDLKNQRGIYDRLGNSYVVREVFEKIASIYGVEYDFVEKMYKRESYAKGGMMGKGGEIRVSIGDKVKSKSGTDGIVYESTGTMFKLEDKYGNKSQKWYRSDNFKPSEITKSATDAKYDSLEGKDILIYSMGVKQPMIYKIKNVKRPNPNYSIPTLVLELTLGEERIVGKEKIEDFMSGKQIELYDGKEYYAIKLASMAKSTPKSDDYANRRNVKLIVIKNPNKNGSKNYLTIDKRDFLNGLHKFEEGGSLSKGYTYIKRADVNQVVYRDSNNKETIEFKPKNGFWVSKKALVDAGMNETKAKFDKNEVANQLTALSNEAWDKLSIQSGSEIYASDTLQQDLADEYQRLGINKIYKQLTKAERKKVSDVLTDENEHSLRNYLALRGYNGEAEYKNYVKMFEEGKAKFGYTSNWNPKNVDLPIVPFAEGGKIGFEGLSNKVAKNYEGKKVAPKYQDEYGKTYDKKEAKEVGKKVASKVYRQQLAKMEHGGELPEDLGKYFIKTRSTKVIPMSNIIPLRARAEGIANAEKYMKMAYDGKMDKRKPITLYKSQGKYRVYDGNSTYAVAKANGWENIWAEVIKNPNMNTKEKRGVDIFTKAKQIRKEGEAWKDALQRAKAMK